MIIRGVNVFPTQIEEALLRVDGTAPHFMIELSRPGNLDEAAIKVEIRQQDFSDKMEAMHKLRDPDRPRGLRHHRAPFQHRACGAEYAGTLHRQGEAGDRQPQTQRLRRSMKLPTWWKRCFPALLSAGRACLCSPAASPLPIPGGRSSCSTMKATTSASGEEAWQQVRAQEKVSSNAVYTAALNRVGQNIAAAANKPAYEWEFVVFDSDEANAFASPAARSRSTRACSSSSTTTLSSQP